MKSVWRCLIKIMVVVSMFVECQSLLLVKAEETELTAEQKNAIAMLNHITVLTQEINASKNSRLNMENAYSSLINNTYPNAVDSSTLRELEGLLDTMEKYRMIDVKRERLQYVYEQSQAQAIRSAIPNPMGLIGVVHSFNPAKLIASVVYMAVDSYTSYKSYASQAEQKFLKDGWALDDEEANVLHESRKSIFSYMVKKVNEYDLPGDYTLTERTVEEFVKWKNNSNVVSRIQFLQSNKSTYQYYGGYWLVLADSYYNNGDYKKCIEAIQTYEDLGVRIFRRDYDLAQVLPLGIAAAQEVYDAEEYAAYAEKATKAIISNTNYDNWALRYFAAQTLVDLYAETKETSYLKEAYDITLNSVNYLMSEQLEQNTQFLSKIEEVPVPNDATKDEKKQIKEYNKGLKEDRKTELPPVYEPLMLNCELLFAIADELKIGETDKTKIDKMLHPGGKQLFLNEAIDSEYWFNLDGYLNYSDVSMKTKSITMPAAFVTKDSIVTVAIYEPGMTENDDPILIDDWVVEKVSRGSEGDVTTFNATYTSKTAKKYDWKPDSLVFVFVDPVKDFSVYYEFDYLTEENKSNLFDKAKVWEDNVRFVQVELDE